MDGFWSHAVAIIEEAGKSPLNLIALALLCSMVVAYVFFRASANWVKLSTYLSLLLFLGVAVIAMAVVSVMSSMGVQRNTQFSGTIPQNAEYTQPLLPRAQVPNTPRQASVERVGGLYSGRSVNGGIYSGTMLMRFSAMSPAGPAQIQLSESNGLQGNCNFNGVILTGWQVSATGMCRDASGFYDAGIQADFIDEDHVHGFLALQPRPGTPSIQQMEEFDLRR